MEHDEWQNYLEVLREQRKTPRERLRAALKTFADRRNWSDEISCLQWMGKRHAVEYAEAVLQQPVSPIDDKAKS